MTHSRPTLHSWCHKGFLLLFAGMLGACGGGGGGGGGGTPPPSTFTIGGTVSGLTGSGLVLQVNGAGNLAVAANATSFVFSSGLASGSAYTVTVLTQPSNPAENCSVSGGSGTVGSGNVTSVSVVCSTSDFTVGGTITGLTGSGLVLEDNGGDPLTVAAGSKSFTFSTAIASGAAYAVSVKTPPSGETCTVTGGSGTVATADVTSVSIACTPVVVAKYTVGGTISGLTSSGLVLSDNVGDHLTITAGATKFTLPTSFASGSAYMVSVATQPSNPAQVCSVANGSGNVGSANVTTVAITCAAPLYTIGGHISGLTSGGLVLQDNAGDNLTVPANATTFKFATGLASGKTYAATVLTQPSAPAEVCTVTNGSGTVAGANVTSITVSCVRVGQFVFVVNETDGANNGTVSAFAINPTTGALSTVPNSPFALQAGDTFPVAIAVDQTGHAYVANAGPADDVSFYDIGGNGALTFHADYVSQGTGGAAMALSVLSPSSQYLYVAGTSTANASNGSISGFMEDPTSGDLSSTSGTPYIDSNSPLRGIAVDPTQQFVFATSSSHDWILAYTIAGGSLTQVINNPFSTLQGSPYGIVASPLGNASGGFVFATNPSTASVSVLSYDNNGNLSVISGSPYLTGNQPEGIAIDPTGKYLYVTNFADNTISSFSVNAQSGALTLIGTVGTGNGPIGVQVDPSGQFVYVANQTDGSVSLFTTNAGTLTAGPTYAAGSGAIAVGIE